MEKKDPAKFEQRVLDRLHAFFDALLVHSDPDVLPLDATFSRIRDITIPVIYTGYICEKCSPEEALILRKKLQLHPGEKFIVVSAGGGNVGYKFLHTVLKAYKLLEIPVHMQIFTGPYLEEADFHSLKNLIIPGLRIERFTDNFPAWLQAADLSISMGGYNTTMNVLAAGTPALIVPFDQNREQRMRAESLAGVSSIMVLAQSSLAPEVMADNISSMILLHKRVPKILLDGALRTEQLLSQWIAHGQIQ